MRLWLTTFAFSPATSPSATTTSTKKATSIPTNISTYPTTTCFRSPRSFTTTTLRGVLCFPARVLCPPRASLILNSPFHLHVQPVKKNVDKCLAFTAGAHAVTMSVATRPSFFNPPLFSFFTLSIQDVDGYLYAYSTPEHSPPLHRVLLSHLERHLRLPAGALVDLHPQGSGVASPTKARVIRNPPQADGSTLALGVSTSHRTLNRTVALGLRKTDPDFLLASLPFFPLSSLTLISARSQSSTTTKLEDCRSSLQVQMNGSSFR